MKIIFNAAVLVGFAAASTTATLTRKLQKGHNAGATCPSLDAIQDVVEDAVKQYSPRCPSATVCPSPCSSNPGVCPPPVECEPNNGFQSYSVGVWAVAESPGTRTLTAGYAFNAGEDDAVLELIVGLNPDGSVKGGRPVYTENMSIVQKPNNRLHVKYSVFTYGGVPFDVNEQMTAIEDGSSFVPDALMFEVGNVYEVNTGDVEPSNGIDIGQPFREVDDSLRLTYWYTDGTHEIVPNTSKLVKLNDDDPNTFELQFVLPIDETKGFNRGDAIGFTVEEDLILL